MEPINSSHAGLCNVSVSCLKCTPVIFSRWYVLGSSVGLFKNVMFRSHLRLSKSGLRNEALNLDAEMLPRLSWFMPEVDEPTPWMFVTGKEIVSINWAASVLAYKNVMVIALLNSVVVSKLNIDSHLCLMVAPHWKTIRLTNFLVITENLR